MSSSKNTQAITVINLKGGVGKTHITWLLAGNCEEQGIKILAIDLDQQGNLTRNLMDRDKNNPLKGSAALFDPGNDVEPDRPPVSVPVVMRVFGYQHCSSGRRT